MDRTEAPVAPNPYHAPTAPIENPAPVPKLESPEPKSSSYKWWVVVMLWWISFFNYADRQALYSVFPLIEAEMNLSNAELGMLAAAFAWIYGLSAPFAGYIVDRVKRTTAIIGGLHAWSVICMATALAGNYSQLLFFRAAEGLGETFYYPASMSLVSDYHGKKTRSRAMGAHQTSVYFGMIGGGFFAGLIGQHFGWRWSFIIFGGMGVILGFILHWLLKEPQRGAADREEAIADEPTHAVHAWSFMETMRLLATNRSLLFVFGGFISANFVATILYTFMAKHLAAKFGLSLAMAALTATVYAQCASMAGAPIGGWMADKWRGRFVGGRLLTQAIGVFAAAPFVVIAAQTESWALLIAGLIAWGFAKGIYDANIFAAAFDVVPPQARGSVAGWMNLIGWLGGGGTAPIIIGYVADANGLSYAIAVSSIAYIFAGIFLVGALLTMKRPVSVA